MNEIRTLKQLRTERRQLSIKIEEQKQELLEQTQQFKTLLLPWEWISKLMNITTAFSLPNVTSGIIPLAYSAYQTFRNKEKAEEQTWKDKLLAFSDEFFENLKKYNRRKEEE